MFSDTGKSSVNAFYGRFGKHNANNDLVIASRISLKVFRITLALYSILSNVESKKFGLSLFILFMTLVWC